MNFIKELLKNPKVARELGLLIVVLILLFMVYDMSKETSTAIRENSVALSANTVVVSQFQKLLLSITSNKRAESNLIETLSEAIR